MHYALAFLSFVIAFLGVAGVANGVAIFRDADPDDYLADKLSASAVTLAAATMAAAGVLGSVWFIVHPNL